MTDLERLAVWLNTGNNSLRVIGATLALGAAIFWATGEWGPLS